MLNLEIENDLGLGSRKVETLDSSNPVSCHDKMGTN